MERPYKVLLMTMWFIGALIVINKERSKVRILPLNQRN